MRVGIFVGNEIVGTEGGASTFQSSILEALIKANSSHQFYIFYEAVNDISSDQENVIFINTKNKTKRGFIFRNKKKRKECLFNGLVLKNKIELVWFLIPDYKAVEAPFVFTVWDLQHRLQGYFPEVSLSGFVFDKREQFYGNAIPKASYVVIGNKEGAGQVEKFYNFPAERIKTIPLPTPGFAFIGDSDDAILSKNGITKNSYIFYPAQFWPHKNHIRILKALSLLRSQGFNLQVVFTGSDKGNENYIRQKTREYGLEKEVKFLGFVSKKELVSLYKNALAMTFASMFGPDNIPPLEAMALSCPVICADADGMREQLGDSALFFKPTDEFDLAQKIQTLLKNESLKSSLVAKGNELAKSVSADHYVEKMISVIDEFSGIRECWSGEEKYVHL